MARLPLLMGRIVIEALGVLALLSVSIHLPQGQRTCPSSHPIERYISLMRSLGPINWVRALMRLISAQSLWNSCWRWVLFETNICPLSVIAAAAECEPSGCTERLMTLAT